MQICITSVVVKMGQLEVTLTPDEARQLHAELGKLLEAVEPPNLPWYPMPYPVPVQPIYVPYDWHPPGDRWVVVTSGSSAAASVSIGP